MKKVALVFLVAVIAPSLVLAWLAARSLRDQESVRQRQESLLAQGVADELANEAANHLASIRRQFNWAVNNLVRADNPRSATETFDERLRKTWPLAEVGFVVTLDQQVLAPSLFAGPEARQFRLENERFLCSRELAQVYWTSAAPTNTTRAINAGTGKARTTSRNVFQAFPAFATAPATNVLNTNSPDPAPSPSAAKSIAGDPKAAVPASSNPPGKTAAPQLTSEEAEFRQIVTEDTEGALARFLQNQLKVMFWYRSPRDPQLVFGAQVNMGRLVAMLRQHIHPHAAHTNGFAVALLNDSDRLEAVWPADFKTDWRKASAAAEIGPMLPHWKVALAPLDPARTTHAAAIARLTIGLLVALLVSAIGVGSWLIVADLRRELALARQKTDFVSNVSHELKTPLTSIRMFSEMLAEGRVEDEARRRQFLGIITAETARLTRLINNVLDFARHERGEREYQFSPCDLDALARRTVESYRPHLEANGYRLDLQLPGSAVPVRADADALAQVLLNLLSNAEKYSGEGREISVRLGVSGDAARIDVLDCGPGVPAGCEEKVFEEFFRAHDSLSSGIPGSGLGLALARRIARAHGGDVTYTPRPEGGSCFTLAVPLSTEAEVRSEA